MVENKDKFYLYDRWYYLIKEEDEKLIYTSKPENRSDGNILEYDKNTKLIAITYLKDKKAVGKLEFNTLEDKKLEVHYQQLECELIKIKKEEYANLLVDMYALFGEDRRNIFYKVSFTKMKKMNKILYRVPDLPMDKKIDMNKIDLESKNIEYIKDLVSYIAISLPILIEKIETRKENKEKQENIEVKELHIPQELEVYDRVYEFVKMEDEKLIFENTESGVYNLEINFDPTILLISSINLKITEKGFTKGIVQILPNDLGGVNARYTSKEKNEIILNDENIGKGKIKAEVIIDENRDKVSSDVYITAQSDSLHLIAEPRFSNRFTDEDGNEYILRNSDYVKSAGILNFSCGIFKHIEKSIFKVKK